MTTTTQADATGPGQPARHYVSSRGRTRRRRRQRFWLTAAAGGGLALGLVVGSPVADGDTAQDLARMLLRTPGLAARPDWRYLPALVGLAGLHYVLAGIALRVAAGPGCCPPLGEVTRVQLVATVANRLTPNGLGGAAVNSRYLSRRGLAMPEAVGAVTGLSVIGAIADALVFLTLLLLAAPLGLRGFSSEIRALSAWLRQLLAPLVADSWRICMLTAALIVLSWLLVRFTDAGRRWPRIAECMARASRRAAGLLRRPADLTALLATCAGTTIVQAVALALSAAAVSGGSPTHDLGGLLASYLVGSTVGGAVPVPAGLGSTEAAMVGAVVLTHVSLGHAIAAVLLFRLIIFWAPVPLGVFVTPRLHRAGAL